MNKKSVGSKDAADKLVKNIRREGIAESLYYKWSKEFLEAGNNIVPITSHRIAKNRQI